MNDNCDGSGPHDPGEVRVLPIAPSDAAVRDRGQREHYAKYETLAHLLGIENLRRYVPATRAQITSALAQDEHLNTIPLRLWDLQDYGVRALAFGAGIKSWSLCETVCVLKHVAAHHYADEVPA